MYRIATRSPKGDCRNSLAKVNKKPLFLAGADIFLNGGLPTSYFTGPSPPVALASTIALNLSTVCLGHVLAVTVIVLF